MHPILIDFGIFKIYTYGFMIAVGVLLGIFVAKREAGRLGENPDRIMDMCFYILVAGIIGSRLFYIATTPKMFLSDPMEVFRLWNGGLVFYGGFIGVMIVLFFFIKKYGMRPWITLDILAPSVPLAHTFGRLGCFFAGCCYGKSCDLPWAVTFSHPESLAPLGIALHPTQLYSSLSNFTIFLALWFFRRKKRFNGQVFWLYVVLYGIARSIIEMFRGDFRGGFAFGIFSIAQTIGLTVAIIGIVILFVMGKRSAKESNGSGALKKQAGKQCLKLNITKQTNT